MMHDLGFVTYGSGSSVQVRVALIVRDYGQHFGGAKWLLQCRAIGRRKKGSTLGCLSIRLGRRLNGRRVDPERASSSYACRSFRPCNYPTRPSKKIVLACAAATLLTFEVLPPDYSGEDPCGVDTPTLQGSLPVLFFPVILFP
jgi:hypothetical protein